jgi:anti-sigma factor RsiW
MNGRGEFFTEELLSGYLDGELSDEQRRYVERMLDQTPEIREKYQALCALADRLRGLDRFRLSEEAALRVSAAVEAALSESDRETSSHVSDDELTSAYFDGELNDVERVAVEQRMEQDERQQRLFDRLCTLQRRLALLPSYRLDSGFAARVVRRIETLSPVESGESVQPAVGLRPGPGASDGPRRFRVRDWRGAGWAIAAIATAILLMVFAQRGGDQVGPSVVGPGGSTSGQQNRDEREDSTAVVGVPTGRDAVADVQQPRSSDPRTAGPAVVPPVATASPFTLVGSLQRTKLVLVYEVLVTEEGVRNAAFPDLLRRHRIGFSETSAIGREEQRDLLRHRFLENVQIANGRRTEMDRVDLYLVRTKALTADAMYADLMSRPVGIGGFALNLTTRDAESRVLNRLCESTGVEKKVGQAVQLLANFGILSSTGRNLGAFGTIRWVDPALYDIPQPRPDAPPERRTDEGEIGLPNLVEDIAVPQPPPMPQDFACELLFVVRHVGLVPEAPADIPGTRPTHSP